MGTINFSLVARNIGMSWTKDLKPLLGVDESFTEDFREVLEEMKHEVMDSAFKVARDGRPRNAFTTDLAFINAFIKWVDSGALAGIASVADIVEEEKEPEMSEEERQIHLERLGLGEKKDA